MNIITEYLNPEYFDIDTSDIWYFERLYFMNVEKNVDLGHKIINEIQSLIVEGGRVTLEGFIKRNLWDEARVFTGDQLFGSGIRAPRLETDASEKHQIAGSMLCIFRNHYW